MREYEGEEPIDNSSLTEERTIARRVARAKAKARANRAFWWWMALAAVWLISMALVQPQEAERRSRIKDVATIEGIRDNQLVGYGLVVGLKGTGDSSQTVFPAQTLVSALQRMGVTVPQSGSQSASNMQVKNMAAVFVVATLPPFSRPGYKVDLTVSSAGDARSLEGGILLMTPLYGVDGQIYAAGARGPGAGRIHGNGRRQLQAGESSHHGAHSWRRVGGADGALRSCRDAHGEHCVE